MKKKTYKNAKDKMMRRIVILATIFLPMLLLITVTQALFTDVVAAASLTEEQTGDRTVVDPTVAITKTVNRDSTTIGSTLQYTILLANSSPMTLTNVVITDPLPAELDFVLETLVVTGGGNSGTANDVITWTGSISGQQSVSLQFDVQITDTLTSEGWLTNTAYATIDGGTLLSDTVNTKYVDAYLVYLPVVSKPLGTPLLSVELPSSSDGQATSQATASWTAVDGAIGYELQESVTSDFANPTIYSVSTTSVELSHVSTWSNKYYYRVRALAASAAVNSGWSDILTQSFTYYDSFDDPSSGWAMRREDTDDVDNETKYKDGVFVMKIKGRWDSMLAGPLIPVPTTWPSYRIDTRVILEDGVDNLHSYGLIFGADWDGVDMCPNSDFTSCYNHYYRVNVVWFGDQQLKFNIKRVDYHDFATDKDVSKKLLDWTDLQVPNASGWNDWSVEVLSDGRIRVYVNGNLVADVVDTKYIGGGYYFGGFASSNEYSGTAAWYDYYRVSPLP